MNHLFAFSQSSMASFIASPRAPFLPPYFKATFDRNSRSRPLGMITMVLPITSPIFMYADMLIYLSIQYIFENTGIKEG